MWKLIDTAPRSPNDGPLNILLARYVDGALIWMASGTVYKNGWIGGCAVSFTTRSADKYNGPPTHWQDLPEQPKE